MSYNGNNGTITGDVSIADVKSALWISGTSTNSLSGVCKHNNVNEMALNKPYYSTALVRYYDNSDGQKPPLSLFKGGVRTLAEKFYVTGDIDKDENFGWTIKSETAISALSSYLTANYISGKTSSQILEKINALSWEFNGVNDEGHEDTTYRLISWLDYYHQATTSVYGSFNVIRDCYLEMDGDTPDGDTFAQIMTSSPYPKLCIPSPEQYFVYGDNDYKISFKECWLSLFFVKGNDPRGAVSQSVKIYQEGRLLTFGECIGQIVRDPNVPKDICSVPHGDSYANRPTTQICAIITKDDLEGETSNISDISGYVPLYGYLTRGIFHSFYMDAINSPSWLASAFEISFDEDTAYTHTQSSAIGAILNFDVNVKNNTGFRLRNYEVRIAFKMRSNVYDSQHIHETGSGYYAYSLLPSSALPIPHDSTQEFSFSCKVGVGGDKLQWEKDYTGSIENPRLSTTYNYPLQVTDQVDVDEFWRGTINPPTTAREIQLIIECGFEDQSWYYIYTDSVPLNIPDR